MANNFFDTLTSRINLQKKCRVVIPNGASKAVVFAITEAIRNNFISAILIGQTQEIKAILGDSVPNGNITFIEASSPQEALDKAISMIKSGEADVLMKGTDNTSDFLTAIQKESNTDSNNFVSHVCCFELPDNHGMHILSDSAINTAFDEESMCKAIENAKIFFNRFEERAPKVALLAANEKVSDKMPATRLAQNVATTFAQRNDILVEGPVSFDLAICLKSAQIKKYKGKIQGDADIFMTAKKETANALYKSLQHYIKVKMGGIVLGAQCPIVLCSRSDNAETNYNSLLLALYYWQKN